MRLHNNNLDVPDSILVLEDSSIHTINKHDHFVFKHIGGDLYRAIFINGKNNDYSHAIYSEYDLYVMFFDGNLKYKECSLESFNNLKAFL